MTDTMAMDKHSLIERAKTQMQQHLGAPDWSLREKWR